MEGVRRAAGGEGERQPAPDAAARDPQAAARTPVVMYTPLPPARTGIAHYASMLLPALRQHVDVIAVDRPQAEHRAPLAAIYQLGNNPHHEWIYLEAMKNPGVVVLHDLVLHHLIVEMTLARGDVDGYVAALRESHGEAGAAWALGRANGLHSEMGNFLLPASIALAQRSRAVIVHNRYAEGRLRSFGVTTPIHVVPHPYEPAPDARARRAEVRARHGFEPDARVIGLFGFLTAAKRSEVVLRAFAEGRARDPRLRLLVVGEPAPNIDVATLAGDGITFTGYVDDDEFAAYYAAVDRLVNLRYPTAGETSGTLIRAFEAGKPVAVSDYAQFAELPDDVVVKIAFDREEEALVDFFTSDLADPSAAQARFLHEHASMEATVAGYLRALEPAARVASQAANGSIPLFPRLALVEATRERITVRNIGEATIATRTYGVPGYRLIVKLAADGLPHVDRWLELPRDLRVGEVATLPLTVPPSWMQSPSPLSMTLHHAIESIPMLEPEAWAHALI